jgi:AcrR family transcriptional regulator
MPRRMTDKKTPPGRAPGRPRSEEARLAVIAAAYGLLTERPLEAISTLEIACRAGVSTATLYRWWESKESVLLDAFYETTGRHLPFRTDIASPLLRLKAHARQGARYLLSDDGRIMAKLIMAVQDNEALRRRFLERFYEPRRKAALQVVCDAVAAGELPPETDPEVLIDAIYGPLYFRLFFGHRKLNVSFAQRIFDQAVAGAKDQAKDQKKGKKK